MKNIHRVIVLLFCILLQVSTSLYAQKNKKTYALDVALMTGDHRSGILKTIDGNDLIFKEKDSDSLFSIPSSDIQFVKVKRINVKDHIIKGAGIVVGAASGAIVGFIIGYSSDPKCDDGSCVDLGPGLRGIAQGLIGGVIGGAFGSLLGNHAQKYIINGLPENLEKMKIKISG